MCILHQGVEIPRCFHHRGVVLEIHLANVELPNAELPNAELLNAELPNAELLNAKSY